MYTRSIERDSVEKMKQEASNLAYQRLRRQGIAMGRALPKPVQFFTKAVGQGPVPSVKPHAHHPRALHWIVRLGPLGLFAVAVVDFSIVPLPLSGSTDLLLLWLVARDGSPWLLVPVAVAGSILGGYSTWHIGRKGGQTMLQRHVPARLVDPIRAWVKRHPILAVCVPPLLPPPIPLTAFMLASGAFGVSRRRFFTAFGTSLTLRYAVIAWIGATYGRHVVRLWARTLRNWSTPLLWVFVTLLLGSAGVAVWQAFRRRGSNTAKAKPIEAVVSGLD
jgi:membrane protein YqaA with SNARE-associated domain